MSKEAAVNAETQQRRRSDLTILKDIEMVGGYSYKCPKCGGRKPFNRLEMIAEGPPDCCGPAMILKTPRRENHAEETG